MAAIAVMHGDDYDAVLDLWYRSDGIGLTPSDSREAVQGFLVRNPGLSLVARQETETVS